MTVTAVRKDPDNLTMTLEAEFEASPERVWQLWADPRQLERWWGPPAWPATVTAHELRAGGRVEYHMTGPEGERSSGYWEILEVEEPRHILLQDGFADADGTANAEMPTMVMRVSIEALDAGRTRMSVESTFPDRAAMEQVLAMGAEEGMTQAASQIDAILSEQPAGSSAVG